MIVALLSIVAPTFVCASIGLFWGRYGPGLDGERTTALITRVGAPCLVFSSLVALDVQTASLVRMAQAAGVSLGVIGVVGWLVLRFAGLPRHTFLPPVIFSNAGNMGLPICFFAFGSEGLALAVCYFAIAATMQYTVGVSIWAGRANLRELVRNPLPWAALLAVGVIAGGVPVPAWIQNTTELLGGLTIPLMLMNLGESIGRMKVTSLGRTLALSVLRLSLGLGCAWLTARWLELGPIESAVLILQSSMPVAVFNYLLACEYDRSPEEVASLVALSTLIAFPQLCVLLAFLV